MRPTALRRTHCLDEESQDLWISVSHAACCQRANAGPDQSSLDFRSSSAGTQTIQLARGQTMSRSCSPPGSVEACWFRFAEAQG
jgi:hypothetical protein